MLVLPNTRIIRLRVHAAPSWGVIAVGDGNIQAALGVAFGVRRAKNSNHRMFRVRNCYSKSSADSRQAMRREADGFLRYKGPRGMHVRH